MQQQEQEQPSTSDNQRLSYLNRYPKSASNFKDVEFKDKKNRRSMSPEKVRYETLSWINREFNPDFKNVQNYFQNLSSPIKEDEGGDSDNDNPNEIKIINDDNYINPEHDQIPEENNMNNNLNNTISKKKKNRQKFLYSPPKLNNRISALYGNVRRSSKDSKFSNDSISSNDSDNTSPIKFNPEDQIPEIIQAPQVQEPLNIKNNHNQQYSYYGSFSDQNYNLSQKQQQQPPPSLQQQQYQQQYQQQHYESLNANKYFKDNNSNEPDYDANVKDNDNQKFISNGYNDKENFSPIAPSIETNLTNANENTPLTLPHSPGQYTSASTVIDLKNGTMKSFVRKWSIQCIKYLPAVLLGVLLNLLDSLSYGIIIFPKHESMPSSYVQSGISMFLVSTVVAQMVYCSGLSNFRGGNGSMMIEVMPFLHIICEIIIGKVGKDHPKEVIATVMVAYAISTILTGVVFYLLGAFKMGNIMSFFPRHILIGCIGGIGLFLLQTGIEIITGYTFSLSFDYLVNIFSSPTLPIWTLSMTLALILTIVHNRIDHPLLVPSFFLILPIIFYIIVWIGKLDLDTIRREGWLFNLISDEGNGDVPFYTFWTYYDFKATQWSAIPSTLSTIFALVFFGILHVPINVPALSVSVNTEVDINKELKLHGYTNFLSGCIGSLQNYLVYSNSVLFIRSGGNSNVAGFMLGVATFALLIIGTSFIKFVPTIIVGGLIFHLGFDLMKEALIDTYNVVSPIEYLTIVLIVVCMDIWGFTEGILVGIIVACIFFIITLSRRKIIRSVHSGSDLPSTVYRLKSQRTFLNNAGIQIKIIRFQGFIFFGTFQQINDYINNVILQTDSYSIKFIIFDFKLVNGMDYSASEALLKVKNNLEKKKIHLVICNVQPTSIDPLNRIGFINNIDEEEEDDDEYFKYFLNYDSAIEWCENMLLQTQYDSSKREYLIKTYDNNITRIVLTRESNSININHKGLYLSPMTSSIHSTCSDFKTITKTNINDYEQPVKLLIQTLLNENNEIDMNVFEELGKYFQCLEIVKRKTLWETTTSATENQIYIVESGQALLYSLQESSSHVTKQKVIGTLIPYSVIGELEFLSKIPHRTKLVALDGCKLWAINYSNYESLCENHPEIALKFIQLILHCSSGRMENMLKHDLIKSLY